MNVRLRLAPDDMRERIVSVAEEHFRRIGFAKTAVADIAEAMNMSPANVYRFFPSKLAINDAICARMMTETDALVRALLREPRPAGERLEAIVRGVHRHYKARLTDEHRLFDMVEVAMAENRPAIQRHIATLKAFLAELIAEGVAKGEFRMVPADSFAETAFEACAKVLHPTLIAQCADENQEDQVTRLTGLILAALRP